LFRLAFKHYAFLYVICAFFVSAPFSGAWAEEKNIDVPFDVRVIDTIQFMSEAQEITLWGVEKIQDNAQLLNLRARSALEEKIGGKPILCDVEHIKNNKIIAQCTTSSQDDVSLFLLQQGYVNADRKVLRGTVYEQPYLKAEKEARQNKRGVWAENSYYPAASAQPWGYNSLNILMAFGLAVALVLCALGLMIMRGFKNAVEVQNRSIDIAAQQRALKEQEKYIIASMLSAEIKSNRTKIEAYLIIHQDILHDVKDESRPVTHQAGGDMIQKQPALSRVVFDNNADKLDMMEAQLASDIIHYYARIKTIPDYAEVKSGENKKDVQMVVETVIENAKKLEELSQGLVKELAVHGMVGVE